LDLNYIIEYQQFTIINTQSPPVPKKLLRARYFAYLKGSDHLSLPSQVQPLRRHGLGLGL
jgi:uncharacterized protein YchJ